MDYLALTLPEPADNLALDEALLDAAEADERLRPVLRLWEPARPLVVVGRASQIDAEVRLSRCRELGVPVLRRGSGGAAIVTGPGCLMYAVVLSMQELPALRAVEAAHRYVLKRNAAALGSLALNVVRQGTSDLAWGDKKFSGNSLRIKRQHLLYHGTLLYDFPLHLAQELLGTPPRQPAYRQSRSHADFLTNLPVRREALIAALRTAWQAEQVLDDWPAERTRQVAARYAEAAWRCL